MESKWKQAKWNALGQLGKSILFGAAGMIGISAGIWTAFRAGKLAGCAGIAETLGVDPVDLANQTNEFLMRKE